VQHLPLQGVAMPHNLLPSQAPGTCRRHENARRPVPHAFDCQMPLSFNEHH